MEEYVGVEPADVSNPDEFAHLFGCSPVEILTGERYATDDKDTDTQRLLDIFSALDWEGKQVVTATAIAENRRIEASLTRARA